MGKAGGMEQPRLHGLPPTPRALMTHTFLYLLNQGSTRKTPNAQAKLFAEARSSASSHMALPTIPLALATADKTVRPTAPQIAAPQMHYPMICSHPLRLK